MYSFMCIHAAKLAYEIEVSGMVTCCERHGSMSGMRGSSMSTSSMCMAVKEPAPDENRRRKRVMNEYVSGLFEWTAN